MMEPPLGRPSDVVENTISPMPNLVSDGVIVLTLGRTL